MGALRGRKPGNEPLARAAADEPVSPVSDRPAESRVPYSRHDTSVLTPQDAFESWRQILSGAYEVPGLEPDVLSRFRVQADLWHLGGLMLTRVSLATPFSASRTPQRVRADQMDHYGLVLQLDGSFRLDAKGENRLAEPGQPIFTDLARPQQRNERDEGTYVALFVPREMLDEALPRPVALHGLTPQGGAASMLSLHLQNLVSCLPSMEARQTTDITKATLAMIAAAVTPAGGTHEAARPVIEATLLRQISRYVELHLTDPGLTPQSICTVFKLSRSALYRLFEPLGGVAAFVRERRLIAIRDKLLAQQRSHPPLQKLADDYGFTSAAHFSKSYRRMFGHRPSEARFGSVHVAPKSLDASPSSIFADWLRSLRG